MFLMETPIQIVLYQENKYQPKELNIKWLNSLRYTFWS